MLISVKGKYPFRLGTTSFIFPADYRTNVQRLAPYVDEIELLFLESTHLPAKGEIADLRSLSQHFAITYNIHLPVDIDMGASRSDQRHHALAVVTAAIQKVQELRPTTHTLHLPFNEPRPTPDNIRTWQERLLESLSDLFAAAAIAPCQLSIETLDYPPQWLEPIVTHFDLPVCVDVGHLLRYGFDLQTVLQTFAQRAAIIHLHGVADGQDHLPLTRLPHLVRPTIVQFLKNFRGSVSIEVFSYQHLADSLHRLDTLMAPLPTGGNCP